MSHNSLFDHLDAVLNDQIVNHYSVSGGDISDAACIETNTQKYFLKHNSSQFLDNFQCEADGLNQLRGKSRLAIPRVIKIGQHEEKAYLILEFIQADSSSHEVYKAMGIGLAELHKHTQEQFGYIRDNYIGSLTQSNKLCDDWTTFYGVMRLEPLFRQGFDLGMFSSMDRLQLNRLIPRLIEICPNEPPALIHGDLWSGNWMSQGNQPYLIDPSVSFAHRELDLAMTRLFGGFDTAFYDAYQQQFPLEPNFNKRIDIYQLYYLLVHAILFHGSYIHSVKKILQHYGS